MEFLKHLKLAKFKFVLEATQPIWLPEYKGSTFRGAFGTTFKKLVCAQPGHPCEQCLLNETCAYYYVFETPNPMTLSAFDSPKVPHPFVIEPPVSTETQFSEGAELSFNLILVGRAIDYLPYFVFTFHQIGAHGGIGKGRRHGQGRYFLKSVFDETDKQIYNGETQMLSGDFCTITGNDLNAEINDSSVELKFRTPVRIKHAGRYLLKERNGELNFQLLIENLYRRDLLFNLFSLSPD